MLLILTGILMFVIDGSVVNIALPTITGYFEVDVAQSQWIVTSYLVVTTSLLMVFGKVSEYTGKTKMFLSGFGLFTLASLACGLSTSLPMLVFFRVLQAAGAAAAFSISAALIFEIYPKGEQGRAMGYIGTAVSLGSIAGPMIGGYLVDFFGWEYIFLINLPIGVILLALAARYMHLQEKRSDRLDLDWIGATLLAIFVVSLMLFLVDLGRGLDLDMAKSAYALVTLASLAGFILQERRDRKPLLDLSVFRERRFVLPNLCMMLFIISSFSIFILGPFYFQGVMGYTPSQVGTVFLIVPAIMAFGAPAGGWIYDRYHYRYSSALGIMIVLISLLLAAYATRRIDQPAMLSSFALLGLGNALFQSPINTEIMSALPPEMLGTASSLSSALRNLGMALGVSLSSILLTLQLGWAGYKGPILEAGPDLLSAGVSNVMVLAALLCSLGVIAAVVGNRDG